MTWIPTSINTSVDTNEFMSSVADFETYLIQHDINLVKHSPIKNQILHKAWF